MSKFICEKDDLIAKLSESNKLIEKYKKFAEHSLEKLKEFECLNVDLDAKLVLSNKLVDNLKCENESLKMHAKCLITNLLDYIFFLYLHACKIFRRSKINSYVTNQIFKFCSLKIMQKSKSIDQIVNNPTIRFSKYVAMLSFGSNSSPVSNSHVFSYFNIDEGHLADQQSKG